MKIPKGLKYTLYVLSLALYLTGFAAWLFARWFQVDEGLGAQPRAFAASALHAHGIVSLFFLTLFGVLFESHIKRGWRAKRKLKTGFLLLSPLLLVMLTVPGLYYLNDGGLKISVTQIHTFLGLILVVPLLIHIFTKVREKPMIPQKEARLESRATKIRLGRRRKKMRGGATGSLF